MMGMGMGCILRRRRGIRGRGVVDVSIFHELFRFVLWVGLDWIGLLHAGFVFEVDLASFSSFPSLFLYIIIFKANK